MRPVPTVRLAHDDVGHGPPVVLVHGHRDYRDSLRALKIPSFVCTGTHDEWSTAEVTRELVGCLHDPRVLTLPTLAIFPTSRPRRSSMPS